MPDTAAPATGRTPGIKDASKRIARFIKPLRVNVGSRVDLARDFDPAFKAKVKKKRDGAPLLQDGVALLADYQSRLAAQRRTASSSCSRL